MRLVKYLLLLYKKMISPYMRPCCRFYPSCSNYTEEAVEKYGVINGCFLALKRLIKCGQWSAGGVDPVP